MGALLVQPVSCIQDNYAFIISDSDGAEAWVVDPAEAAPVQAMLLSRGLALRGILLTHHHLDHVGGAEDLVRQWPGTWIAANRTDCGRLPLCTAPIAPSTQAFAGTDLTVAGRPLLALGVPGHTRGSVAWYLASAPDAVAEVFTGDTLFGGGCGRLFEGTADEMWHGVRALTALPAETRLWFGHEYTAENLRFAATVEPDNQAIQQRIAGLAACTVPTTVALERATNPFVRACSPDQLGRLRQAKNRF